MDRAYQSGAAVSAPSAPASPSTGYPTAGNPGSGTPATTPGPYWYHMIMEELMAVISAAGIEPAQGNLTQLLTALRSAGVFQTAPQFDNDTSVATTAFVQRALGNFAGFRELAVNTTLDASDCGKVITVNNATITLTLPGATGLAAGAAITFCNVSPQGIATVTIQRQGADSIWANSGQGLTSFTLAPNESVTLVRQTAGAWKQVSGQIGFGSSLAASGYQKLPSGVIVQWGNAVNIASASSVAVTYPIAFPNGALSASATVNTATNTATPQGAGITYTSASQLTIRNLSATTLGFTWIAIGY